MKIFSDDGVLFSTIEECEIYEAQRAHHIAQKSERKLEVENAKTTYMDLLNQYNADYAGDVETEKSRLFQRLLEMYS